MNKEITWNSWDFFPKASVDDVQCLIYTGVDVNDYYGCPLLEEAVRYSPDLKVIKILLSQGPRLTGYELFSAIRRATLEQEIIELLLAAGAESVV